MTRMKVMIQRAGIPMYVLAAASRVHPSTLSRYQRGQRIPASAHVVRIAAVLGCEPEELMGMADDPVGRHAG